MPTLKSVRSFVFRSAPATGSWERDVSALNMPTRFGSAARMVSFLAHEHAFRSGSNCVDADHLVLALLDEPRALATLRGPGVDVPALRGEIARRVGSQASESSRDGILPKSSGLHRAWHEAHAIARRHGAATIEPEHLLMALVTPPMAPSKTAKALIASGFRGA